MTCFFRVAVFSGGRSQPEEVAVHIYCNLSLLSRYHGPELSVCTPVPDPTMALLPYAAVIRPRLSVRHGTRGPAAPCARVTLKFRNNDRSLTLAKRIFINIPRVRSDPGRIQAEKDNGCRRNAPAAPEKAGTGCPSGKGASPGSCDVQRRMANCFVV